jgi:3-hydroxyisobutyrate dehydrogenase-like beta-hydroxyacid dehydrogenase
LRQATQKKRARAIMRTGGRRPTCWSRFWTGIGSIIFNVQVLADNARQTGYVCRNGEIKKTMSRTCKTAVIGLGSMGYGIALSVLRDGHETYGFDVDAARMTRFVSDGGLTGALADIAPSLEAACVVVLNAAQTEAVLFGPEGIVPHMQPGAVVIACATVPPAFARDMEARCAARGVHYLDAPISGGSVKAAQGALSIMAAGTPEAFTAARPLLDSMAETVFELGNEAGPGSAMKAVNQLLAGVHIATMAEALTFGMTQGVSPEQFVEVISKCAGSSWMLENRAPHIVAGDYTPHSSVNIWPKDLGIVLDIAKSAQFSAPITAVALQQFVAAAGQGLGQEDDAAVAKVYARNAGLTLPGEE